MKRLLWSVFVLIVLLIFIGFTSCINSGDEERPGMPVNSALLVSRIWEVTFFEDNGQDQSNLFTNIYLEFRPNFRLAITKGCLTIEGEWVLSNDSTLLVIRIPNGPAPLDQLNDEWVITLLTDKEMHLIEQDDKGDEEFHLKVAPLQALNCQSCSSLTEVLVDSVWSITLLESSIDNLTDELRGFYLKFKADGTFVMYSDHSEQHGVWAVTDNCKKLVIHWSDEWPVDNVLQRFQDTWLIEQFENDFLALISYGSSEKDLLHLTKGRIPDCSELQRNLLNTSWFIDQLIINKDDVTGQFVGTGLTFLENNQLATEVVIGPAVLGGWMLSGNCNQLTLDIQAGSLQELSKEWTIMEVTNELLVLVFEQGTLRMELHLKKGQPTLTPKCMQLIDFLVEGVWKVYNYSENENPDNDRFAGYSFQFNRDGSLIAQQSDEQVIGRWYPIRGCYVMVIEIANSGPLGRLNGGWSIKKNIDNTIILVYDKTGENKQLVLKRD